jgi:hypothetical protein
MNEVALAVRPRCRSQKRINASRVRDTSLGASRASYSYKTGRINWCGQKAVAIVIGALPDKVGFFADRVLDTLVIEILTANPTLSAEADLLQLFVSTPPGLHVAPWRRFNLRTVGDRQVTVAGTPQAVPSEVTQQLEVLFQSVA